jgi:hypothetical protein
MEGIDQTSGSSKETDETTKENYCSVLNSPSTSRSSCVSKTTTPQTTDALKKKTSPRKKKYLTCGR